MFPGRRRRVREHLPDSGADAGTRGPEAPDAVPAVEEQHHADTAQPRLLHEMVRDSLSKAMTWSYISGENQLGASGERGLEWGRDALVFCLLWNNTVTCLCDSDSAQLQSHQQASFETTYIQVKQKSENILHLDKSLELCGLQCNHQSGRERSERSSQVSRKFKKHAFLAAPVSEQGGKSESQSPCCRHGCCHCCPDHYRRCS